MCKYYSSTPWTGIAFAYFSPSPVPAKSLVRRRHLGLNHATVGRQLTALEEELGTPLVERQTNGCAADTRRREC